MNLKEDLARIDSYVASKKMYASDATLAKNLLIFADTIEFGKKGRIEGYIQNDDIFPRCTTILNFDGSKAAALLDWSKKEVVKTMNKMLNNYLSEGYELNRGGIDFVCTKALNEPDRQKDEAADAGAEFHDNCELGLLGKEYKKLPRVEQFLRFWESSEYLLISTEIPLIWRNSDGTGFGGKCDILAYKDGKFILIDLKSSKAIHMSYGMQLAAYGQAILQMSNIVIDEHRILHYPDIDILSKTQKKDFEKRGNNILCKNMDMAFTKFRLLLELYNTRNEKFF